MRKRIGPAHNRYVHGMTGTPTYKSWTEMKGRCLNPENNNYPGWGGRGIQICDRWKVSFQNFLDDMGEKPPGTTLERVDNDGNYEPENCIWADRTVQSRNRSFTKLSEGLVAEIREDRASGMTLAEISAKYQISISHAHRVATGESWK